MIGCGFRLVPTADRPVSVTVSVFVTGSHLMSRNDLLIGREIPAIPGGWLR